MKQPSRATRFVNYFIRVACAISLTISAGFIQSCGDISKDTTASIQGQLVDQNGRPVSQQALKIERVGSSPLGSIAFTDFSGTFQFLNLPSGTYRIYPLGESSDLTRLVELHDGQPQNIGTISLKRQIKVELNREIAKTIDPAVAKTINPDAAQTLNPEAAKTLNVEAAKMINPEAAKTINPEAAKTINADAAYSINPAAAKVLNPDRAITLTKEQAATITPEEAAKPMPYRRP